VILMKHYLLLLVFFLMVSVCNACFAQTPPPGKTILEKLRTGGYVLFMRHAHADVGEDAIQDQNYWKECQKQRNLSAKGKLDANAVGIALRGLGVPISQVMTSNLCRAVDTAKFSGFLTSSTSENLSDYNTWVAMGKDKSSLLNAYRQSLSTKPPPDKNILLISHAQRGKYVAHPMLDLIEMGTIAVFQPNDLTGFELIAVIRPEDWKYLGVQEIPSVWTRP
jgi:phosphohistidine phosphatase SixA